MISVRTIIFAIKITQLSLLCGWHQLDTLMTCQSYVACHQLDLYSTVDRKFATISNSSSACPSIVTWSWGSSRLPSRDNPSSEWPLVSTRPRMTLQWNAHSCMPKIAPTDLFIIIIVKTVSGLVSKQSLRTCINLVFNAVAHAALNQLLWNNHCRKSDKIRINSFHKAADGWRQGLDAVLTCHKRLWSCSPQSVRLFWAATPSRRLWSQYTRLDTTVCGMQGKYCDESHDVRLIDPAPTLHARSGQCPCP